MSKSHQIFRPDPTHFTVQTLSLCDVPNDKGPCVVNNGNQHFVQMLDWCFYDIIQISCVLRSDTNFQKNCAILYSLQDNFFLNIMVLLRQGLNGEKIVWNGPKGDLDDTVPC